MSAPWSPKRSRTEIIIPTCPSTWRMWLGLGNACGRVGSPPGRRQDDSIKFCRLDGLQSLFGIFTSLIHRLAQPFDRLIPVFLHAIAVVEAHAKIELGFSKPLLRRLLE